MRCSPPASGCSPRQAFRPLDPVAVKWENKDLVLVTSLYELDGVTADPAPNVRYVGPAFAWPPAP